MEMDNSSNATNGTCTKEPDETKAWTLVLILVGSVIANVCTIALVTRFKVRRVPDILVIGLAVSDLFAVCIPVVISVYEYYNPCVDTSGTLCSLFATLAHFTRYSSALIVSVVSVERYFAVNRPFAYRTYIGPFPYRFVIVLFICWFVAAILAIVPAVFPTNLTGGISKHDGYCLFYLQSKYAIAVLIYAIIQYGVVCLCFTLVAINLVKVYRRRKRMTSRGTMNQNSHAAKERQHQLIFMKTKLTSRISDLGKSLKTGITEKFQLGVEAEFGRMFFLVVVLFYITWTTIVVLIIIAQIKGTQDGLEEYIFWGIRLTVVSTLVNPLIYGIFARQYRTGYLYVLRLFFSKIFSCVDPPVKNIFASSDPQSEARRDTRRYDTRLTSAGSSEPVLVRSQATPFTTLSSIKDVDYLVPDFLDSTTDEHSMHTAKAGYLSSTAVIPYQLQGLVGSPYRSAVPRRSHSLSGIAEESHYREKISSTNKLALILNEPGDATVINEQDLIEPGKVYSNPAYEHGSHSNTTFTPSPSEQGGLTPTDMGSTDFLVQRSPIMSHGPTREGTNTSPHQFELSSLCTVVASHKEGETCKTKDKVKLTPNTSKDVTLVMESAVPPTEEDTLTTQDMSQTEDVTSQKGNVTLSDGISPAVAEYGGSSLPMEDQEPAASISAVAEGNTSHTDSTSSSTKVLSTIVVLQQANTTTVSTTGRRESATREFGSKTVQELKRQYEVARKTPSLREDNLPSPHDMVLNSVSKNSSNLRNNGREHHSA